MKQLATSMPDLHDYDSYIKRADGKVPYNGYLWPTEDWWPNDEPKFHYVSGSWNFGIIALNDGRYSVEGTISHIEKNTDNPYPRGKDDTTGKPVVFATREKAIRISAARMIKDIRAWRFIEAFSYDKMSRDTMEAVINWTRNIVAKECGVVKIPVQISMPEPPPSPPKPTGLELIDYINKRDHADRLRTKNLYTGRLSNFELKGNQP